MTLDTPPALYRVAETRQESADVASFRLEGADGRGPGVPGQFNMLTVFGVGEAAISLAETEDAPGRFAHTVRAVGPVSRALAALDVGDVVGVRGPFGVGWPAEAVRAGDVVVVAGGIGLAPLRPLVRRLIQERDRYGRVALVYGARRPDDRIFLDELEAWRARGDITVRVTVDRAPPGWNGRAGFVTQHMDGLIDDPATASAFLCGPEVMMRFAAEELIGAGVSDGRIWVSLERNMNCGVGLCGHCQVGPLLVCRDGPVVSYAAARPLILAREL